MAAFPDFKARELRRSEFPKRTVARLNSQTRAVNYKKIAGARRYFHLRGAFSQAEEEAQTAEASAEKS